MRVVELKIVVWSFISIVLATLISLRYLDAWLAIRAMKILNINAASNIPDVLFILVCFVSGLLWGRYVVLRRRDVTIDRLLFYEIAGTAVPLTFLLKWPFKLAFGKTNTRVWLENQSSSNFHWFHGGGNYNSFPSGHMMVFAAFFTALWFFYPRYRLLSVFFMLALSAALIVTNHHFLSDVIVGGYIGFITTLLCKLYFEKVQNKTNIEATLTPD